MKRTRSFVFAVPCLCITSLDMYVCVTLERWHYSVVGVLYHTEHMFVKRGGSKFRGDLTFFGNAITIRTLNDGTVRLSRPCPFLCLQRRKF